jgi:hypothetical protein
MIPLKVYQKYGETEWLIFMPMNPSYSWNRENSSGVRNHVCTFPTCALVNSSDEIVDRGPNECLALRYQEKALNFWKHLVIETGGKTIMGWRKMKKKMSHT